ncbi:hypothetical protein C479_08453 [Halovivax asiaticus JCM 14624]|uniref:UPF0215 protein C479_08453 n=1 Tax=Halovivax asiaticus JCM 14624 TaxID=1227490 RepID=M0BKJ4_9EURY|nr:DUF99 family protein [Halovivax asiaticus]ELZ10828.1 hypothetical protein C479_08453 [Halovivax asiaticus JCM 14624]
MPDPHGRRVLGIADSSRSAWCTLAGAVVRGDRVVDGASFATATVGGCDATDAVLRLVADLDRADIAALLLGTIAPAWYNVLDLERLHEETRLPTVAVTFEESDGLEQPLREAFSGEALAARLERYRSLPSRHAVTVGTETVYVRAVGCEPSDAETLVTSFTPVGGRPEPIRVARQLARAGAAYREQTLEDV